MKTVYKAIFLLLVGNGLIFISQGCLNRCGKYAKDYRIESIAGKAIVIIGIDIAGGRQTYQTKEYLNTPVRYDSMGFEFKTTSINIAHKNLNPMGFSSANACDPALSYEEIKQLKIVSNKDYNAQYLAGSDLQGIMTYSLNNEINGGTIMEKWQYGGGFSSYFMKPSIPPSANVSHDFTFTFLLERGKIIVVKLNNIILTK